MNNSIYIEDRDFKIGLLKEFWDKRDQSLIPAKKNVGLGLKKQKFLFFYNLMAKESGEPYTLSNLKAFKQGPVYYDIYSYIKQNNNKHLERESITPQSYPEDIINAALTLIEMESPSSLSDITHQLDLWIKNYDSNYNEEIIKNEFKYESNNIYHNDITEKDYMIIRTLKEFSLNIYRNYNLEKIRGKVFAIEKINQKYITEILYENSPKIIGLIEDIYKIDNVIKVNYDKNFKDNGFGGIVFDL